MIRVLVAGEDIGARQRLLELLQSEPDIAVVAVCQNGGEIITEVRDKRPNMLFLEVEIPGIDSFDVLDPLDPEQRPIIVFTTSYAHHAVKASGIPAQGYPPKLFHESRFQQALKRVRTQISAKSGAADSVTHQNNERILIRSAGRMLILRVKEIDWIEAAGNYVRLHVGDQVHRLRGKISTMEERLNNNKFVRIHRSFIVNSERISEIQPCGNCEYLLVLTDGKNLSIGRSYWNQRSGLLKLIKPLRVS
ncbi:MAG TPA: LytTR family DNA-binding domain-containing protein [Candidatus Angelobacter sp.]